MSMRILLADDHGVLRGGLRVLLNQQPGFEVVGEAADGREALRLADELHPDLALVDITMPLMDGIEVTRALKERQPGVIVLILSVHEDQELLREAIKAGAAGYILKHAAEAELIAAIQRILRGDLYVDPALVRLLVQEPAVPLATPPQSTEALTPREIEVLKLIVQGYTNRQIGEELNISFRTAESHRASLSEKLGMHSRVELVRYAREHGLIE